MVAPGRREGQPSALDAGQGVHGAGLGKLRVGAGGLEVVHNGGVVGRVRDAVQGWVRIAGDDGVQLAGREAVHHRLRHLNIQHEPFISVTETLACCSAGD